MSVYSACIGAVHKLRNALRGGGGSNCITKCYRGGEWGGGGLTELLCNACVFIKGAFYY